MIIVLYLAFFSLQVKRRTPYNYLVAASFGLTAISAAINVVGATFWSALTPGVPSILVRAALG
ncbi:MAG: hypothetical protein Kow0069_29440 [Promethearchaeota archaeon]